MVIDLLDINSLIQIMSEEQRNVNDKCSNCVLVKRQRNIQEAYASVIELLYSIGFLTGEISQDNTPRYSYYIYRTLCELRKVKPMSRIKFAFWYAKNYQSADREYSKLLEKLGVANE